LQNLESIDMLGEARIFVKMFFDYRKHSGTRSFRFRPRSRRQNGMNVIDLRARGAKFNASVFLRPGTSDWTVFEQVFLATNYDARRLARYEELSKLYCSLTQPLILDLGANIGLASLYFLRSWPRATVVAVEPDVDNIDLLRLNAPRVRELHAAIASETCRVRIANPDDAAWAYRTEQNDQGTIDGITVSTILDRFPTCQPFICKIDIEGAETELLSQNTDWVARFPIVILEPHDWLLSGQATARNFLRTVAELDRDFFIVGENIWSISNAACT
jgi:FkbM family methyltransferase